MDTTTKLQIIDTLDANTPPLIIGEKLTEIIENIWKSGLTKTQFSNLIEIFIENDDLDAVQRKIILDCLIPNFVITDKEIIEKLLIWFFTKFFVDPESSSLLLTWISALVEHNLMDTTVLEMFYGQLASCFQTEIVIKPLCQLLNLITNEKTVNKRASFVINEFYKDWNSVHLRNLLWKIKMYAPDLVDIKFSKTPRKVISNKNIDRVLEKTARKQGIFHRTTYEKEEKYLPGVLPDLNFTDDFSQTYQKVTHLNSARELGNSICKLSLSLPENYISLIGNKFGMIYLESVGPNNNFFDELKVLLHSQPSELLLAKLIELQKRLRHGLPIITKYLAEYLLTWDGLNSQHLVFELIKWVHFNTFHELSSTILLPLSRIYICSSVAFKKEVLEALTYLIINMVSVHLERLEYEHNNVDNYIERPDWLQDPTDVFVKLCSHVQSLVLCGLLLEGPQCTTLMLQALSFNQTIITLQLEFTIVCIIPPVEPLMYSALICINHLVLNEVGSLLVRYKKEVFPFLDNLGKIDEFPEEINIINEVSDNIFSHLWLEKDLPENNIHWSLVDRLVVKKNFNHPEKVRFHPGVFPLIEFLAKKLKIKHKNITNQELLQILLSYSEGLGQFIKYHLEEKELSNL